MNEQHRAIYIEAVSKLQDAIEGLRRIPPQECPVGVYGARRYALAAQRELENELHKAEQAAEQDVLATLARRQRAAGEVV